MMNPAGINPGVKRRACVTCTQAKSKCTPQSEKMCERCARLGKQCVYLDLPERRRRPRNSQRQVDTLEEKVSELMTQWNILRNQSVASASSSNAGIPPMGSVSIFDTSELGSRNSAHLMAANDNLHHHPEPAKPVLEGRPDIIDRGLMSLDDADTLIQQFRSHFVPKFPFVVLRPDQTAALLKKQEPFLFLCIIAATIPRAHPLQKPLAEEIMNHITSRIIAGSERNLGLLRGLLVKSAWYRYPAERRHVQLVLLVDLCMTIVYDLRLHHKPNLSSDEQRSLLGAYWLSVGLARTIHRPTAMEHTKRIEEYCDHLAVSTEHLSDRWIPPFILVQSFISRVNNSYGVLKDPEGSFLGDTFLQVITGPFLREMESFRASLDKEFSSYPRPTADALLCDMHYIDMCIRDVVLGERISCQPEVTKLDSTQTLETSTFRTSMLWSLLRPTKEFMNAFLSIPDTELSRVTVFTLAQLCTALATLPKTASALLKQVVHNVPAPGRLSPSQRSEVQAIVNETDYLNIVAKLLKKLDLMTRDLSDQDRETDIVGSLCSTMRLLACGYSHFVKGILGLEMVNSSTVVAASTQPEAISTINGGTGNQDMGLDGPFDSDSWPLPYPGLDDSNGIFDDTLWSTVFNSLSNFA